MPITDLIGGDFGVDIGAPTTGPDFDTGWDAPSDWLDWLTDNDFSGLPQYDVPGDVNPYDWASGTQTTMWEAAYSGIGLPPTASGDDIATWIAEQSYTGGNVDAAVNWFEQTYGQQFDFMSFDNTFGLQLDALEEQYAMQEANMWELFEQWQGGQVELLEDQFGNMSQTYSENLSDIQQNKKEQLSQLIANRRGAERGISEQLKSKRQSAGRAGFGTTFRYDQELDATANQLGGLTAGAYDISTGAAQAEETLAEEFSTATESAMSQYQFEQEQQFLNMENQLEQWQLEFENSAETMYQTWAQGIFGQISNMLLSQGEEWFETLGGTGSGYEFDPFADSGDDGGGTGGDDGGGTGGGGLGGCDGTGISCPEYCQGLGYTSGFCAWDGTGDCNCWSSGGGGGAPCEAMQCPPGECPSGTGNCSCVPCGSGDKDID